MITYTGVPKSEVFTGDGVQKDFPFNFDPGDASYVRVYVNDNLLAAGKYSVNLSGHGGTVTLQSPLPVGNSLVILIDVPVTQEVDIQNNTAFLPEILETALDKLTLILKQQAEELERCAKLPPSEGAQESWSELLASLASAAQYAEIAKKQAALAQEAARQVTRQNIELSGNRITLSPVPWTMYKCTEPLSALILTNLPKVDWDTIIYFTTGSGGISLVVPEGTGWIGTVPDWKPNSKYVLCINNGNLIAGKVN